MAIANKVSNCDGTGVVWSQHTARL